MYTPVHASKQGCVPYLVNGPELAFCAALDSGGAWLVVDEGKLAKASTRTKLKHHLGLLLAFLFLPHLNLTLVNHVKVVTLITLFVVGTSSCIKDA